VRGLGEIALRVNNMDAMQKFYEEVIGLPLMNRDSDSAFFKIAEGYGGHTQVVACSTAPRVPAIAGRTRQLPPSTTLHLRYVSLILQAN
jgi:catechol-2,3-dioxygenase